MKMTKWSLVTLSAFVLLAILTLIRLLYAAAETNEVGRQWLSFIGVLVITAEGIVVFTISFIARFAKAIITKEKDFGKEFINRLFFFFKLPWVITANIISLAGAIIIVVQTKLMIHRYPTDSYNSIKPMLGLYLWIILAVVTYLVCLLFSITLKLTKRQNIKKTKNSAPENGHG